MVPAFCGTAVRHSGQMPEVLAMRRIDAKIERYAGQLGMGTARCAGDRASQLSVGRYLVFYRIVADGIEVARILHGARDLKRLFGDRA
jgi:toxin ParE1/3/4